MSTNIGGTVERLRELAGAGVSQAEAARQIHDGDGEYAAAGGL